MFSTKGHSYPLCLLALVRLSLVLNADVWQVMDLCSVRSGIKGGHRAKTKTFSCSILLPAIRGELIHSKQIATVPLNVSMLPGVGIIDSPHLFPGLTVTWFTMTSALTTCAGAMNCPL